MATIVTFFSDERSAEQLIQQLSLETSIQSITYLNNAKPNNDPYESVAHSIDLLIQNGFNDEQCNYCLTNMDKGKIAVVIESEDAADMLLALQNYGVREYHMV